MHTIKINQAIAYLFVADDKSLRSTHKVIAVPEAKKHGLDIYIHQNENGQFFMVDGITGYSLGPGCSKQKECMQNFEDTEHYRNIVNEHWVVGNLINQYIDTGKVTERYISGRYDETNPLTIEQRISAGEALLPKIKEAWDAEIISNRKRNAGIVGASPSICWEERRYNHIKEVIEKLIKDI